MKNQEQPGVFGFLVSESTQCFLGAGLDISSAIEAITEDLRQRRHPNLDLQYAWRTYGEDGIDISLLEDLPAGTTPKELQQALERWLRLISYAELL